MAHWNIFSTKQKTTHTTLFIQITPMGHLDQTWCFKWPLSLLAYFEDLFALIRYCSLKNGHGMQHIHRGWTEHPFHIRQVLPCHCSTGMSSDLNSVFSTTVNSFLNLVPRRPIKASWWCTTGFMHQSSSRPVRDVTMFGHLCPQTFSRWAMHMSTGACNAKRRTDKDFTKKKKKIGNIGWQWQWLPGIVG